MSTLLLYRSSLTISGAVYPTVPHGVIVSSFQTIFERPKSAILTRPMPPPPMPGRNSPSSSLSSSYGRFFDTRDGMIGIASKRMFSGLMSLAGR